MEPLIGPANPLQNRLLAGLPPASWERVCPRLRPFYWPLGRVLYESGDVVHEAYFPVNSIISLLYELQDGTSTEIALVGREGVLGITLFTGGDSMPNRAVVQNAGWAYRLEGQFLAEEFLRDAEMQRLLLLYTQARLTQASQNAVCNRYHSLEQRLCRLILQSCDCLGSNQLEMTHELIAHLLGVRREGVTDVAGRLRSLGVIDYAHGHIRVLDLPKLEQQCCECYAVVRQETDRLLESSRA